MKKPGLVSKRAMKPVPWCLTFRACAILGETTGRVITWGIMSPEDRMGRAR